MLPLLPTAALLSASEIQEKVGKHICQANKCPGIIPLDSLEQDFVILGGEANIHSCVYSLPVGSSAEENTRNLSANCQARASSLGVPPAPTAPQLTLCACGITKELGKRQQSYLWLCFSGRKQQVLFADPWDVHLCADMWVLMAPSSVHIWGDQGEIRAAMAKHPWPMEPVPRSA